MSIKFKPFKTVFFSDKDSKSIVNGLFIVVLPLFFLLSFLAPFKINSFFPYSFTNPHAQTKLLIHRSQKFVFLDTERLIKLKA